MLVHGWTDIGPVGIGIYHNTRVEVGKEEKRRGVAMPVLADNMGSTSCR